jgi:hypothetical protein
MTMNKLTKKGFRSWLQSLPPRKVVSPSDYGCESCPIAMYADSQGWIPEGFEIEVTCNQIALFDTTPMQPARYYAAPQWVHDFVDGIDAWSGLLTGAKVRRVTARRALRVLDG